MPEPQQLARQFSTSARALKAVGSVIIDKSPLTGQTFVLRTKELKLQRSILKAFEDDADIETALARACFEAGVTLTFAKEFFESRRYKDWIADRQEELEINTKLTPGYIAKWHKENIEGRIKLSSQQLVSLQELSDRIWPKVQKVELRTERPQTTSMDDLLSVRQEVDELEKKLLEAHTGKAA